MFTSREYVTTLRLPCSFRVLKHCSKPQWVRCSPQHEVVAMVPFLLGFSTPDSRPSLRDRKLSPKLPGFPTRRCTFVRRPQSPPQSPRQTFPKNLPFAWSTCSVGLRGWCRVIIVVACAPTSISRPPFDLLAEAKKGHVWLDPKKNHSGKSTLYPLHLQTIVDIETSESCRPDSAAKIHQERCHMAFRL